MTQQVVLITGALTGIGRATARPLPAKRQVVVSGRHDDKGHELVKSCERSVQRPNSSTPT